MICDTIVMDDQQIKASWILIKGCISKDKVIVNALFKFVYCKGKEKLPDSSTHLLIFPYHFLLVHVQFLLLRRSYDCDMPSI